MVEFSLWVALTLGLSGAGPYKSTPRVRVRPVMARPGDMVQVEVWTGSRTASVATASFMGNRFFLTGRSSRMAKKGLAKRFHGFVAVPLEAESGRSEVGVQAAGLKLSAPLRIRSRSFGRSTLTVAPRFTQKKRAPAVEERLQRERAEMEALWTASTSYMGPYQRMCRPLKKMKITSKFGTKRVFNGELKTRHYGTDYRAGIGVPVHAIMPGRVVLSSNRYMTGGSLVVDHGRGLFSLYFHLSKRRVRVGQMVKCGQRLGLAGASGRATGPHLHLSVVVRAQSLSTGKEWGMYVEPQQVLSRNWLSKRRLSARK